MSAAMRKIVVLNPKGGSGKTTIATNLAAYFANSGLRTALLDLDLQGSSVRWGEKRRSDLPEIEIIKGYERSGRATRSWLMRITPGTERLVIDTPAGFDRMQLQELTRDASSIVVPVLPSDIDIHAASRCIADLLLVAKIRLDEDRIGVVANRARTNTRVYRALDRFLSTLRIPFVTTLRDAQNYVRAAGSGRGIHEMKPWETRRDVDTWEPLISWIERRGARVEDVTAA